MMKNVLRTLDRGEVLTKEELAAKAGIDVSSLDGALDFLVKRDYLKEVCDDPVLVKGGCAHCGARGCCMEPGKTYVVTEKGKKLAYGKSYQSQ